uniref:Uncharacterized protein n=1 Tax=Oryza nivara TaxID=4536 RepID=A0A0E0FZ76_ORYNI
MWVHIPTGAPAGLGGWRQEARLPSAGGGRSGDGQAWQRVAGGAAMGKAVGAEAGSRIKREEEATLRRRSTSAVGKHGGGQRWARGGYRRVERRQVGARHERRSGDAAVATTQEKGRAAMTVAQGREKRTGEHGGSNVATEWLAEGRPWSK